MNIREITTRNYDISNHKLHSLHPIMQKIFLGRGVRELSQIEYNKYKLLSYHGLLGVEQAADLVYSKIIDNSNILIVGDYDADGATSTALCMKYFYDINYKNVNYIIPNRIKDGYGLTTDIVKSIAEYSPSLIITVDNGISSIEGVKYARSLGIDVLITDHHLPGEQLPCANVIVNPNQPGCDFHSKNLAGVGVVFYVLCSLRAKLTENNYFLEKGIEKLNMSKYLDLVALGTVADVVPLDYNNRTLVQLGLNNIRAGKCSYGIMALCEVANREYSNLVASDFGFALAPRLNAAGRLDDMDIGIKCLISNNLDEGRSYASVLNKLNEKRKLIETEMKQEALDVLSSMNINFNQLSYGICLYNPRWHEGVIGILASRIKDQYNRPTLIFTSTPDPNILKGSARSISGIHIKDILEKLIVKEPKLILKFGGHAMAAGLSIEKKYLEKFNEYFTEEIKNHINEDMLKNVLVTDGEIELDQVDLAVSKDLHFNTPWGQGFPEPSFVGDFNVIECFIIANKHLRFILSINERQIKAIAFNVPKELHDDYISKKIQAVYRISINNYYEYEEVQFIIEQFQLLS